MWRTAAAALALVAIAWFEFEIWPGHSYLASTSQLYVPVLEHLVTPAYLSRDMVATHPNLAFTIYDELTLFLRAAGGVDFERALTIQQFFCRLAGLFGIYFLARAAAISRFLALGVAGFVGLGTFLPGPHIWLFDPEPVPRGLAIGYLFLAIGCLVREKTLIAGLFGGLGLLYDPAIAAPFWITVVLLFLFEKRSRKLLRPMWPVLLVFILLLANLAQLQPGTPDSQRLFTRFSRQIASIEQFRTPELWISLWPAKYVYFYLAIFVIGIWATTRIAPALNRQAKWLFTLLPLMGVLSLPCSKLLVEHYRWPAALRAQPMQTLIYTLALAWLACAIAAVKALRQAGLREGCVWAAVCLLILAPSLRRSPLQKPNPAVAELAAWAEDRTWGSSMFLFPDAARELYPGVFRAKSRRALWVDWETGKQMNYFVSLAPEWSARWKATMEGPLSGDHLQAMLSLPIDYFVFRRNHLVETETEGQIRPVKPVFLDAEFAVYEASTLRLVPGTLAIVSSGS